MFKSCRGPPAERPDNFSQQELVKRPQNKPRQLWYVDAPISNHRRASSSLKISHFILHILRYIFHNQETIWLPSHGGILQTHQGMKISPTYSVGHHIQSNFFLPSLNHSHTGMINDPRQVSLAHLIKLSM